MTIRVCVIDGIEMAASWVAEDFGSEKKVYNDGCCSWAF